MKRAQESKEQATEFAISCWPARGARMNEQLKEGDIITATAEETKISNKIGIYYITVTNQKNEKVALFKGTVYRTSAEWFPA